MLRHSLEEDLLTIQSKNTNSQRMISQGLYKYKKSIKMFLINYRPLSVNSAHNE